MAYLVDMQNITVRFPGVIALNDVPFNLKKGEVHVLIGENGAGKSTLIKVLSGINKPDNGEIIIGKEVYKYLTPEDSARNKIAVIYQELSLVDELSIAENLFLGKLPFKKVLGVSVIDNSYMNETAEKYLKEIGLSRKPSELVKNLTISEKQQVEIAKALSVNAKIIVMDEPTSSLSTSETENLHDIIDQLKEKGIGIIYISHKLKDVKQIGDRVTVLKDGKHVQTIDADAIEVDDLIPLMVGRKIQEDFKSTEQIQREEGEVLFEVRNLTREDNTCRNINFKVYNGEILGFAGLIGAGRSECMEGIFGAKPISSGEVYVKNQKVFIHNPYQAMKKNIAMVTENRREKGFFPNFPIWKEIAVTSSLKKSSLGGFSGLVKETEERRLAKEVTSQLNTRCSSIDQYTVSLSGGNQQKVIVGKWLSIDSDVFIFDEPTKGIDVGAKSEMYQIMRNLAKSGKAVIMVSSEMPELLSTCDRIIVMSDGEISKEFMTEGLTEEQILRAAIHSEYIWRQQ